MILCILPPSCCVVYHSKSVGEGDDFDRVWLMSASAHLKWGHWFGVKQAQHACCLALANPSAVLKLWTSGAVLVAKGPILGFAEMSDA